ncbi:hypothetical protein EMIHUDRAFT_237024 [Emiliania huxleyi CCMP1516]|uniref:Myb-like domain-containing protein n=2 Tax=Emiliania huxleyi TaxID=2903 RepID=A0A0D3JRJ0_EMIH1|nr:hypothetical protein EMIHUDRAFT_237024 [Emiliania huxleyi CCMP1516]EOD26125.1 hypothetical protein EMIHUDRAFT_237024 [Emiliania huxleyi CCMP1516]|eukprot:XP_005778554.1 hypothetical protein EMIHUDRAFT_237024 [Emiliania huxleyi CCMP1516]
MATPAENDVTLMRNSLRHGTAGVDVIASDVTGTANEELLLALVMASRAGGTAGADYWQEISTRLGSGRSAAAVHQHYEILIGTRRSGKARVPKTSGFVADPRVAAARLAAAGVSAVYQPLPPHVPGAELINERNRVRYGPVAGAVPVAGTLPVAGTVQPPPPPLLGLASCSAD